MTLSELLEELKEVDPKLYDDISHLELVGWQQPRNQAMDHLQGSIQRAIERRVDYRAEKGHETWGMILEMGRDGPEAWIWGSNGVERSGYGDSPAEALLAAYVAAIKEEKR